MSIVRTLFGFNRIWYRSFSLTLRLSWHPSDLTIMLLENYNLFRQMKYRCDSSIFYFW